MKRRPFEGKESLSLVRRKPLFKLKKGSLCFLKLVFSYVPNN